MTFAHAVAYFSYPSIAVGAGCIDTLRRRKTRGLPPSNLFGFAALFFIAPPLALVFAFANATEANLFVEDLAFVALGVFFLVLMRFSNKASSASAIRSFGIALMLLGAYEVSGDFLRPRIEISGVVANKYVWHGKRGSLNYQIAIDGRTYPTTAEVYEATEVRTQVRAAVGRASGTVFDIAKLSDS